MNLKLATSTCMAAMGAALALTTVLAADAAPTDTQTAPPVHAAPLPKVDPLADQLLTKTCKVLGSADAFSFRAEVLFDQVLPSNVKVQFAGAIDFALHKPDHLPVSTKRYRTYQQRLSEIEEADCTQRIAGSATAPQLITLRIAFSGSPAK